MHCLSRSMLWPIRTVATCLRLLAEAGHLDIVIHNAGHMVFGPAEAFTPEQLAELYDVNVLSTQRINRAVLPILRKQGRGLVVWVGSSSTRGGHPLPRSTLRSQSGDGCDGCELRGRVSSVEYRNHYSCSRTAQTISLTQESRGTALVSTSIRPVQPRPWLMRSSRVCTNCCS